MSVRDMVLAPAALLVLGIFLVAARAPESAAEPAAIQLVGQQEDGVHVGVVLDWRLDKLGTVFVLLEQQLEPQEEDERRRASDPGETVSTPRGEVQQTWFKTPPIQGQQIHFQDLVLLLIAQAYQRDSVIRFSIWSDASPNAAGTSPEEAITMTMIGAG